VIETIAPPQLQIPFGATSQGRGRMQFKRQPIAGLETKAVATEFKVDRKARTFSGAFAHFGSVDLVSDILAPGSADRTLKQRWPDHLIKTFYNHDYPCGPRPIRIEVQGDLLVAECSVTNIPEHDFILAELEDKTLAHGSIGWIPRTWTRETVDGKSVRVVSDFDLVEVSPVYFPANPLAQLEGLMKSALPGLSGTEKKSLYWLASAIWQLDNAEYAVQQLASFMAAGGVSSLSAEEQAILAQLVEKLPAINAALLALQVPAQVEAKLQAEPSAPEAKSDLTPPATPLAGVLAALEKRMETFSTAAA
jgi:HK97 family phage prohead protease